MSTETLIQGSVEWHLARLGMVTASRVADVIATTKSGWGASRANYMAELVAERLTGVPADSYSSPAMKWGTETEPLARAAYQFYADAEVVEVGFVKHPADIDSGASPDGLIGTLGLVEIKCPNTATHIDTLLGQKVPSKYVTQMQWQMACTGRQWCDFASFDPRMPEHLRLFVKRLERDQVEIDRLEGLVRAFLMELYTTLARLEAL
jgi:putative phage-type endonuclease